MILNSFTDFFILTIKLYVNMILVDQVMQSTYSRKMIGCSLISILDKMCRAFKILLLIIISNNHAYGIESTSYVIELYSNFPTGEYE